MGVTYDQSFQRNHSPCRMGWPRYSGFFLQSFNQNSNCSSVSILLTPMCPALKYWNFIQCRSAYETESDSPSLRCPKMARAWPWPSLLRSRSLQAAITMRTCSREGRASGPQDQDCITCVTYRKPFIPKCYIDWVRIHWASATFLQQWRYF